ncbi:rab3 GTPase-activating protein catalytic subunit isoform X2 [Medicago truncatula]|uniref:Rab3 GTPase-activating protein catalytic subunit n=2 Tax=Medicago truncatula TaxID=3880 RepID=A0A072V6S0_MEDTR|nr:rab3 GTPase-activating protein catalytic subunit isoform X2 [Medicago truncatula]KEH33845.1 Rab3 GTPase-activating protein catalytic subunit [Medicago truncatula]
MELHVGNSFVSKARTVLHSAAVKAERVLNDFKSDLAGEDFDKHLREDDGMQRNQEDDYAKDENESKFLVELKQIKWRPRHFGTKQHWKDRINNIRKGRKESEDTDKVEDASMDVIPLFDEMCVLHVENDLDAKGSEAFSSVEGLTVAARRLIPPSSVLKQLAIAVEAGMKANSMKNFAASTEGSSPSIEKAGLRLSAVKALVLREKEDKLTSEFTSKEKFVYLISSLFNPEGYFLRRKINSNQEEIEIPSLIRDIHGAPPESLVVKLAEVIGNLKTLREMEIFWCRVIAEIRKLWSEEKHLPGVPLDDIPDLKSCLLNQQFQVINCCISRKRRHIIASESLDYMLMEANSNNTPESTNCCDGTSASRLLYARLSTGELVLRLGAHCPSGNLTLLETGEPAYSPITQEAPLLTEDLIKETEELILQTGSFGAGCSQLLSDMQAFKAANPGCILEDFVRWYSPPDWTEIEASTEDSCSSDGSGSDSSSNRGHLSRRMRKEGNLWRELWETSKPVPAVKQAPLFDEDLTVEGILDAFKDIQPVELFGQLFVSLLGLGFTIAEPLLSGNDDFSKLFNDCKEFVVTTCQSIRFGEKIDELVQVYETVETLLQNPEEALKLMKHSEESTVTTGETKRRFKKLSHIFAGKDKLLSRSFRKDQINDEEKGSRQSFSSFFDRKSSLFSKKPPKRGNLAAAETTHSLEDDWTII